MPKQQHHPQDAKSYYKGANRDLDKELLGSMSEGEYIDSQNMRVSASDGDAGSIDKILGEDLVHPNEAPFCIIGNSDPLPGAYICIGTVEINDHIVEFWADDKEVEDSVIRIDGVIVLKTPDFPIKVAYPLQIAKNESCVGGEVYITDYNTIPLIFNIEDLIENKCNQRYFEDFDIAQHVIILKSPVDHPVFVELVYSPNTGVSVVPGERLVLGGGGGTLPVGTYQYRVRYVSDSGDRTKMSVATPPIPVPKKYSGNSDQYPYVMTRGATAGESGVYNIKIRFRVTNLTDYDFIEVIRVAYNSGGTISSVSSTDVIAKIEIDPQEISVIAFIDDNAQVLETVTAEETTDVLKTLSRAKAIRYFNQRLFLMNVEYQTRDVEGVTFKKALNNETIYATMENIGKAGHKDVYSYTNYKSYMHGERYGYAVVFMDSTGERSFAIPVENGENFKMPERRDPASINTLRSTSNGDGWNKTVVAADIDGTINYTHEVFDLKEAVQKTDVCSFINISEKGSKVSGRINKYCATGSINSASDIGFKPFHPTNQDDGNVAGHNFTINTAVNTGLYGWVEVSDTEPYKPKGFAPRYFSLGTAVHGIENIPVWAESMAIVRTDPAGRVVTQGLGFYRLEEGEYELVGKNIPASKVSNRFWFHSPDIQNGFVSESLIGDNIGANGLYKAQLVSPLGFFSEVYSGRNYSIGDAPATTPLKDSMIDMISYVRILKEDGSINIGDSSTEIGYQAWSTGGIGNTGYVTYGKWRNSPSAIGPLFDPNVTPGTDGNIASDITSWSETIEGRGSYFDMQLDAAVYKTTNVNINNNHFTSHGLKNWHEPMYMVNIVNNSAQVQNQDISEYLETGHYQKIDAIIGLADGSVVQEYYLVDERWEDCVPDSSDPFASNEDKIIQLELTTGIRESYINISFKSATQIATIVNDIGNNGFFVDSLGRSIYGMYKSLDVYGNRKLFKIIIDNLNISNNVPDANVLIRVKYDSNSPLRVFGGDVTVNEAVFAPLDKEVEDGGGYPSLSNNPMFYLNLGFPYHKYEINPRYYQLKNNPPFLATNIIQDTGRVGLQYIRQMIAMYTVESRGDMGYIYHDDTTDQSFALKHYTVRPQEWKPTEPLEFDGILNPNNRIFDGAGEYGDTYPDTIDISTRVPSGEWRFGGFKFTWVKNNSYSHKSTAQFHFTKPRVGFKEENLFCTRIIWSEVRPVNLFDSPGIKTFREQSRFDISDNQGGIKYAFDSISSKGSNLYAICDSGICLLMTDKRILSDANASELAIIGTDASQAILKQLWITKDIGMHDEMWRSAAEFDNTLFFANHSSVYIFSDNAWKDIGREGYHTVLRNNMLDNIADGYKDHVTGTYDRLHNEYWINYKRKDEEKDIVFSGNIYLVDEGQKGESIKDSNIINLTGTTSEEHGKPQVTLSAYNATWALTARDFKLCATKDSEAIDVINPIRGVIYTIEPGDCVCITAIVKSVVGKYGDLGAKLFPIDRIEFIDVDLYGFYPGDSITLCFFNRKTNDNVCEVFTINLVGADYIIVDIDDLKLSEVLDKEDVITVIKNDINWGTKDCDITIDSGTFAYNVVNKHWNGKYDYQFDKYLAIKNRTYGMRDLSTYELNKGFKINGEDITCSVIQASSMQQMYGKEFIRIRVASDNKPTRVEFGEDPDDTTIAVLDPSIQGQGYLKDYRGYEQYIPRKQDNTRQRIQGRLLVFKVIHNKPEHFKIIDTAIQYKVLK